MREFKCAECCKSFITNGSLDSHLIRRHNLTLRDVSKLNNGNPHKYIYLCSVFYKHRAKTFVPLSLRKNGDVRKRRFKCDECGKKYGSEFILLHHKKSIHENLKYGRIKCESCSIMFSTNALLDTHIKNIHDISEDRIRFLNSQSKTRKIRGNYEIIFRGNVKVFNLLSTTPNNKQRKQRRRKNGLSVENSAKFSCPHCPLSYNYSSKISLLMHVKNIHPNAKRITCKFCDFSSVLGQEVKKHEDSVHAKINGVFVRPWECYECGRRFNQRGAMESHHLLKHVKKTKKKRKSKEEIEANLRKNSLIKKIERRKNENNSENNDNLAKAPDSNIIEDVSDTLNYTHENRHENYKIYENRHENDEIYENGHENHEIYENGHENHKIYENGHENHEVYENGHENHEIHGNGHENHEIYENRDENPEIFDNFQNYEKKRQVSSGIPLKECYVLLERILPIKKENNVDQDFSFFSDIRIEKIETIIESGAGDDFLCYENEMPLEVVIKVEKEEDSENNCFLHSFNRQELRVVLPQLPDGIFNIKKEK